jgi:transposase InsO family protein
MKVSRSGFYTWQKRPQQASWTQEDELRLTMRTLHAESKGLYGVRKMQRALARHGWQINHKRVARLMRLEGLQSRRRRRFRATTQSNHMLPVAPNVLNRDFNASRPNQTWVSDITAVWTQEGWLYLAVVIDLFSRRVIGWAMMTRMTRDLVIAAVEQALHTRQVKGVQGDLIFHSDQGSQFASSDVVELIELSGITQSMSRRGDCYDNAVAESFFASYKLECVPKEGFTTQAQAKDETFEWIEIFYNRKRLHSTLGYITPVEAEARVGVA